MSTEKRKRQRKNRVTKQVQATVTAKQPPQPWGQAKESYAYGRPELDESIRRMAEASDLLHRASVAVIAGKESKAQEHVRAVCAMGYNAFEEGGFDALEVDQMLYSAAEGLAGACLWREEADKRFQPLEPWSWIYAVVHTSTEDLDEVPARAVRYALRFAGLERAVTPVGRAALDWADLDAPRVEDPEDTAVEMLMTEGANREEAVVACVRASIWLHYQAQLVYDRRDALRAPPNA